MLKRVKLRERDGERLNSKGNSKRGREKERARDRERLNSKGNSTERGRASVK